ncbi:MAG: 4-alpha-glucanotransferase [Gammaproteobacteria bacterium]|nr:4-alpha-glucanotransferase [Gammaproteobacteria bacterium]
MRSATKQAGVCLHLSSLPGPYGIGEIGAHARDFIHTIGALGMRVWQFLPTGPVAYGNSPYQPLSIHAGNEMLIAIDGLIADGMLTAEEVHPLTALPHEYTDYSGLIPLKKKLLDLAAERFLTSAGPAEQQAYADFLAQHEQRWLHNYALFRTLKTLHDERAWPEWEPRYIHREPAALEQLTSNYAIEIARIKVLQFFFFSQWTELHDYARQHDITLFGDIPIYLALDSADAWARPDLLEIDEDGRPLAVAGVPPDYFSADGQLWGNPLYAWRRHAETGFEWWIDRVRHATTMMDLVRLDHFRGFESYWSIPASATTARDGKWLKGPADSLFDALKNALGNLPLVAEDLGDLSDDVVAFLSRLGLPGMTVLQFMIGEDDFDVQQIQRNTVCYTGTHDNDTTVGWFLGGPGDVRSPQEIEDTQRLVLSRTGGTASTVHLDLIRVALNSAAELCIIPMQDILGLGSEARMNTPGTTTNNWRWRLGDCRVTGVKHAAVQHEQDLDCSPQVDEAVCRTIRKMVAASGRTAE